MKRLIALLIAILILGIMFAGCGEDPDNSSGTSSVSDSDNQSENTDENNSNTNSGESSEEGETLQLPDKYWGETLVMLVDKVRYYEEYEFWWEEAMDDVVVTAVVDRSRTIEEKYGIKIQLQYVDGLGKTIEEVDKAISGGLDLHLVADGVKYIAPATVNNWFYDLREENEKYGYLQLEASWWDQTAIRDLSMGNRLFFLTGDICISDDVATWAMFFNKDLIEQYHLENPYTLVKEGKWTLDQVHTMLKEVVLKNGETMSFEPEVGDRWGMVAQTYDALMFMLGSQQTMVAKNTEDLPELRIMDETNLQVWDKVFNLLTDTDNVGVADFFGAYNSGVYDKEVKIFSGGNALFMPYGLNLLHVAEFTESDVNYGLVPMPKYSEAQDEYSSSATVYWLKVVAVPLSNIDKVDCALFAMEALAYYGQQYVTPKFYEQVMKGQKVKDEESEEMLDLIFRNRTYDMSTVFDFGSGNNVMIQFYTSLLFGRPDNKIASAYEQKVDIYQNAIDDFIDAFKNG